MWVYLRMCVYLIIQLGQKVIKLNRYYTRDGDNYINGYLEDE